jgi:hypothetical protein
MGSLRIRRANFLLCGHASVAPLTDTALIARKRAMVQWWYGKQRNKLRSALLRK